MAKQTKKARYTDADIDKILHINQQLSEQVDGLQSQLTWLKRQIFGNKSEKLRYVDNPDQAQLDMGDHPVEEPVAEVEAIKPYKRRKKKPRSGTPDDSGIRFDEQEVDIKIIELPSIWMERKDRKSRFKILKWSKTYLKWFVLAFIS